MASARAIAWIDRLVWVLVYGGCGGIILGLAAGAAHVVAGWSLGVLGALAVAGGVVLLVVRSRLHEPPAGGAQSSSPSPNPKKEIP